MILIAGIGNIFFGDDAFGCEVAQRLTRRPLPADVKVVDFGIRALDLAYALLEADEAAILVDALPRGDLPGTLYVLEPDVPLHESMLGPIDGHTLDPMKVLQLARGLGGRRPPVYIVGCEPSPMTSPDDVELTMSQPVLDAVGPAVCLVESLVGRFRSGVLGTAKGEPCTSFLSP